MPAPHSKPLKKLTVAARSAGTFLLTVCAVTIGLTGVYKARAVLDAHAAFYSTKTADARPASENVNTEIAVGSDPKMAASEPPPAVTQSRGPRDEARGEQQDVTSSIEAGRGVDAGFTTIYIHRGPGAPSAYVVPRE